MANQQNPNQNPNVQRDDPNQAQQGEPQRRPGGQSQNPQQAQDPGQRAGQQQQGDRQPAQKK